MNRGLYASVAAMRGAERSIQYAAHNLANLSTPGFKRTRTMNEEFVLLTDHGVDRGRGAVGRLDFSQGPIDETGDPRHLALEGAGFFAFESPTGEVLSRHGGLVVDDSGELVSEDGLPVAWERRVGRLDPLGEPFEVREDGVVFQGGREIGSLRIVDYEDHGALEALAGGYYRAPRDAEEVNATATVHQGALEQANLSGIQELVEMVTHQRAYDVAARSVALINSSYERLNRPNS